MAYTPHTFCWFEIGGDPDRTRPFYAQAIGVQHITFDMGGSPYTMFAGSNGVQTGGYRSSTAPGWLSFMAVEDVDAAARRVGQHGGSVLQGPFDLPVGRMAVVAGPGGAPFALFKGHNPDDEHDRAPTDGGICWTEVFTDDLEATVAFLTGAFGFEVEQMAIHGGTYTMLKTADVRVCGVAQNPDDAPPHWLNWFQVRDCDAAVAAIEAAGGARLGKPGDYPGVGRLCLVADPCGARFGVMTPQG